MALHFVDKYNLMVVKVTSKWELRRLCRAVGATTAVRLGPLTPEEMGYVDLAETTEIGGRRVTIFRHDGEDGVVATVALRGSTMNLLEDVERAVGTWSQLGHGQRRGLAGSPRSRRSPAPRLRRRGEHSQGRLPGLSSPARRRRHRNRARAPAAAVRRLSSRPRAVRDQERACSRARARVRTQCLTAQTPRRQFAAAFEVVPRTLAENSGQGADEAISSLYAAHTNGQTAVGIDVEVRAGAQAPSPALRRCDPLAPPQNASTMDAVEREVFDLYVTKANAIKLATDAAITVLRVDQIIMAKAAGGPKPPKMGAPDA